MATSSNKVKIFVKTDYRDDNINYDYYRFIDTQFLNSNITGVQDGNFHHVIIRRNYLLGEAITKFYLDGLEVVSDSSTNDPLTDRTAVCNKMAIEIKGKLDHLKIFHQDLLPEQFNTLQFEAYP